VTLIVTGRNLSKEITMTNEKRLNPDIRIITYGKRELKDLTLYPLSIGDQFKVTDMITLVVQNLVAGAREGQLSDVVFMTAVMNALETNLGKILTLISDIPETEAAEVINELTNTQFLDIIESVWAVDYEPALKKGKNLFERGKSVFGSKRLSQSSSNATLNTDLKTSIEEAIETVE
jgi:hypothetical protein